MRQPNLARLQFQNARSRNIVWNLPALQYSSSVLLALRTDSGALCLLLLLLRLKLHMRFPAAAAAGCCCRRCRRGRVFWICGYHGAHTHFAITLRCSSNVGQGYIRSGSRHINKSGRQSILSSLVRDVACAMQQHTRRKIRGRRPRCTQISLHPRYAAAATGEYFLMDFRVCTSASTHAAQPRSIDSPVARRLAEFRPFPLSVAAE